MRFNKQVIATPYLCQSSLHIKIRVLIERTHSEFGLRWVKLIDLAVYELEMCLLVRFQFNKSFAALCLLQTLIANRLS